MASTEWRVAEHGGISGLIELRPAWRRIAGSMMHARSHHEWEAFHEYVRYRCEDPERLRWFAVSYGEEVRAIVPVEPRIDRSLFVDVGVLATVRPTDRPIGDIIADDAEAAYHAVPLVIGALRDAGVREPLFVLGPLASDSPVWLGMADAGLHVAERRQGAWGSLDVSGSYDAHLERLDAEFRGELRRARSALYAHGGVRFVTEYESEGVAEAFDMVTRAREPKPGGGVNRRMPSHRMMAWYRAYLADLARTGRCGIDVLYLDDACVAAHLCVRTSEVHEIHPIGFDDSWNRMAPCDLLTEHTLKRCFEEPSVSSVEFMGDPAWRRAWGVASHPLSAGVIPLTGGGRALMPLIRFRFGPARRMARMARRIRHSATSRRGSRARTAV